MYCILLNILYIFASHYSIFKIEPHEHRKLTGTNAERCTRVMHSFNACKRRILLPVDAPGNLRRPHRIPIYLFESEPKVSADWHRRN